MTLTNDFKELTPEEIMARKIAWAQSPRVGILMISNVERALKKGNFPWADNYYKKPYHMVMNMIHAKEDVIKWVRKDKGQKLAGFLIEDKRLSEYCEEFALDLEALDKKEKNETPISLSWRAQKRAEFIETYLVALAESFGAKTPLSNEEIDQRITQINKEFGIGYAYNIDVYSAKDFGV